MLNSVRVVTNVCAFDLLPFFTFFASYLCDSNKFIALKIATCLSSENTTTWINEENVFLI